MDRIKELLRDHAPKPNDVVIVRPRRCKQKYGAKVKNIKALFQPESASAKALLQERVADVWLRQGTTTVYVGDIYHYPTSNEPFTLSNLVNDIDE